MGIFIIINYSLLFVHLFDFFSVLFLSLSRSLARSLSPTPQGTGGPTAVRRCIILYSKGSSASIIISMIKSVFIILKLKTTVACICRMPRSAVLALYSWGGGKPDGSMRTIPAAIVVTVVRHVRNSANSQWRRVGNLVEGKAPFPNVRDDRRRGCDGPIPSIQNASVIETTNPRVNAVHI